MRATWRRPRPVADPRLHRGRQPALGLGTIVGALDAVAGLSPAPAATQETAIFEPLAHGLPAVLQVPGPQDDAPLPGELPDQGDPRGRAPGVGFEGDGLDLARGPIPQDQGEGRAPVHRCTTGIQQPPRSRRGAGHQRLLARTQDEYAIHGSLSVGLRHPRRGQGLRARIGRLAPPATEPGAGEAPRGVVTGLWSAPQRGGLVESLIPQAGSRRSSARGNEATTQRMHNGVTSAHGKNRMVSRNRRKFRR